MITGLSDNNGNDIEAIDISSNLERKYSIASHYLLLKYIYY